MKNPWQRVLQEIDAIETAALKPSKSDGRLYVSLSPATTKRVQDIVNLFNGDVLSAHASFSFLMKEARM